MKKTEHKIAILISARNEELVINKTLEAIKKLVSKKNIYVVNDASTDNTLEIIQRNLSKRNILINGIKSGKTKSLNKAIVEFKLADKYDYIFPIDADTVIGETFIDEVVKTFKKHRRNTVAAVIGRIKSDDSCYLTSYRVWEYEIAHSLIKAAQSKIGAVTVCSGCATVYSSHVLKEVLYPDTTATEDMDLTFTVHRQKLGKIIYADDAVVHTQDPNNIRVFTRQLIKWYSGFWQCVVKHNIPWGGQILDFEVALLALGGIASGFYVFSLITLLIVSIFRPDVRNYVFLQLLMDVLVLMIPTTIFAAYRNKTLKIFKYIGHFYLLRYYCGLVFTYCLFKVILGIDVVAWERTQRYKIQEVMKFKSAGAYD